MPAIFVTPDASIRRQPTKYSVDQRSRVRRFVDVALANFREVLLVPGNHDHYDGVFDDTAGTLARYLPGVTVLDNRHVEIGGIRFFGTTLWSDFEGRSAACMTAVRRGVGDFFFVKKRDLDADGKEVLRRLEPRDALAAFDASIVALHAYHCAPECSSQDRECSFVLLSLWAHHSAASVDHSILWPDWSNKILPMTLEQSGHKVR